MFLRQIYQDSPIPEKLAIELQDEVIYKEFLPKRQLKTQDLRRILSESLCETCLTYSCYEHVDGSNGKILQNV